MEQTRLIFKATKEGANYIDVTKALTLVNGKHYTQFVNDKPQAYAMIARLSSIGNQVDGAMTGWAVRNALVKTAAAWKKMLKKAGIKKSDLNTYGKELRVSLDTYHRGTWGTKASGAHEVFPENIIDSNGRIEYDTGMKDSSGNPIHSTAFTGTPTEYDAVSGSVYREHAFDKTLLTVPNADDSAATELTWTPMLIGTGSTSILENYIESRKRSVDAHDDDFDIVKANPDNYLSLMLSDNEESSDDVLENTQDVGDFRPYSLDYQNEYSPLIQVGTHVAGQDSAIVAPLGLLKWTARVDDVIVLTITGHMNM